MKLLIVLSAVFLLLAASSPIVDNEKRYCVLWGDNRILLCCYFEFPSWISCPLAPTANILRWAFESFHGIYYNHLYIRPSYGANFYENGFISKNTRKIFVHIHIDCADNNEKVELNIDNEAFGTSYWKNPRVRYFSFENNCNLVRLGQWNFLTNIENIEKINLIKCSNIDNIINRRVPALNDIIVNINNQFDPCNFVYPSTIDCSKSTLNKFSEITTYLEGKREAMGNWKYTLIVAVSENEIFPDNFLQPYQNNIVAITISSTNSLSMNSILKNTVGGEGDVDNTEFVIQCQNPFRLSYKKLHNVESQNPKSLTMTLANCNLIDIRNVLTTYAPKMSTLKLESCSSSNIIKDPAFNNVTVIISKSCHNDFVGTCVCDRLKTVSCSKVSNPKFKLSHIPHATHNNVQNNKYFYYDIFLISPSKDDSVVLDNSFNTAQVLFETLDVICTDSKFQLKIGENAFYSSDESKSNKFIEGLNVPSTVHIENCDLKSLDLKFLKNMPKLTKIEITKCNIKQTDGIIEVNSSELGVTLVSQLREMNKKGISVTINYEPFESVYPEESTST